MALKVFICYRREDTRPTAGRIHDSLKAELKSNVEIFRDVKNIPYGDNFVTVVEKALKECDVFLPLVGSRWLDVTDEQGQRRIDDPGDTVHIEIATAIRRGVPIIPILIDRAGLPKVKELPTALASLVNYHGLEIDNDHYEDGIEKLVDALKVRVGQPAKHWSLRLLSWQVAESLWSARKEGRKGTISSIAIGWPAVFAVLVFASLIVALTRYSDRITTAVRPWLPIPVQQAAVPTPLPSPKSAETRQEALRQMVDGANDVDGYLLKGSAQIAGWLNILQFHQLRVINEAQAYASGLEQRVHGLSNIRDQYFAYPEITKGLDAALPSLRELSSKTSAFSHELSLIDSSADARQKIFADGNRLLQATREAEANLAPLRSMQITSDGTEQRKEPPK
jgi:hypothetical protein